MLYVYIELNQQTVKIDKGDEIRAKITVKWWLDDEKYRVCDENVFKIYKIWRPLYW